MKREAGEVYGVSPDRIDVVPNAVDPMYKPVDDPAESDGIRKRYGLDGPFILYVGALQPRKNLVRLATAFQRLQKRGLPHKLVFTGKATYYGPIAEQIHALNLGDRLVFTGYVDAAELPRLMAAADAFAYVSLYEGFGIPVVEALSCGTPALISTDPALCEISGGLAHAVDPLDVDAIEAGLLRVITDEALRTRVRSEGPARARFYSPENMARSALKGYQTAMEMTSS